MRMGRAGCAGLAADGAGRGVVDGVVDARPMPAGRALPTNWPWAAEFNQPSPPRPDDAAAIGQTQSVD